MGPAWIRTRDQRIMRPFPCLWIERVASGFAGGKPFAGPSVPRSAESLWGLLGRFRTDSRTDSEGFPARFKSDGNVRREPLKSAPRNAAPAGDTSPQASPSGETLVPVDSSIPIEGGRRGWQRQNS